MGKKRDSNTSSNDNLEASKRHKKHKKHKKKKVEYDSDAIDVESETLNDNNVINLSVSAAEKLKSQTVLKLGQSSKSQKKKKTKGKDTSGTSSEEERWLDAIESGKLEEVDDELKKIKDPKLMTARQRAMYDRGTDNKDAIIGAELLMSLPSGYKEKVMTAEAIQKAQIKSQKRKQMADEKREKDKKKTMERLLKKQDSKVKSIKNRPAKCHVPMISYRNTIFGATLTFPPNIEFPLKSQTPREPPMKKLCAMPNCNNIKRYNCSKTNTPLCSFKCYKDNVATIKNIIC